MPQWEKFRISTDSKEGATPGLTASLAPLENHGESKSFIKTAFTWTGSVAPSVLPRVLGGMAFAAVIAILSQRIPALSEASLTFEYFSAVLGLLLIIRVNAGIDRWWEARKIWGSIVNQSRNLAIIAYTYSTDKRELGPQFLHWVAAWPHIMRESLRREEKLGEVTELLGAEEAQRIRKSGHMPTYVGARIAQLLVKLREHGLDDFAFQRAERERALLIDAIGACERIRNTPIPLALAIKTRRFILLFVALLPFALIDRMGYLYIPFVVGIVSYPLFALDEIGAELQNPFSPRNVSHLPLNGICDTIEENVLSLRSSETESIKQYASDDGADLREY